MSSRRWTRIGARLLALALALEAGTAWASGGARKLVASGGGERLAVLGDQRVTLDDGDGRVVAHCAAFEAAPARSLRRWAGALDPDEALGAAGLTDDDDSTDAEDALEDEGLAERPRHTRADSAHSIGQPRDIALSPASDAVWVAASDGLYRASSEGCSLTALAGRDLLMVAAGEDAVATATETLLWRLDPASSS